MSEARVPRCHVESPLAAGSRQRLDARSEHHVARVLRKRDGDSILLFNGDGFDYAGTIAHSGRHIDIDIHERTDNPAESPLAMTLIQAISRGERMERSLRQAVEIGATALSPVYTRHSVSPLDARRVDKKLEHWQRIVISAAEQCGRSRIPVLEPPRRLADALAQIDATEADNPASTARFVLDPAASTGIDALDLARPQRIHVTIGPESGLDEQELALAQTHGFTPLRIGPRVLRTETAGPVALALLQARFGDMA